MFLKLLDLLFFLQSRKSFLHSQGKFPWPRNLFIVKEVFLDQGIFQQSKEFSLIKNQGTFPPSRTFSTKRILLDQGIFPQTKKSSTDKEIFCKKVYLIKEIFHKQKSFQQMLFSLWKKLSISKDFSQSKKFFAIKDQKGSLKATILDSFKSKSYEKIFLTL